MPSRCTNPACHICRQHDMAVSLKQWSLVPECACSKEMKRRFANDANWTIEQGSALDENYLRSLGTFDIVYSWGVLHHTGDMWKALDLATIPVREKLLIAIYNDQGLQSRAWKALKRLYVSVPPIRPIVAGSVFLSAWLAKTVLHPNRLVSDWRNYVRGMSPWRDAVDWAGGYPFEVATPAAIASFYNSRGFTLERSKLTKHSGCNEFVFVHSRRAAYKTPEHAFAFDPRPGPGAVKGSRAGSPSLLAQETASLTHRPEYPARGERWSSP